MKRKIRRRSRDNSKTIDQPFDAKILRRARRIAARYAIVLRPDTDLGYVGRGLEFPLAFGDGHTPDECVRQTREAFVGVVAYMIETGQTPPAPASEAQRSEQINVRVTAEEKLLLEQAAKRKGFRGVSDFVRNASLAGAQ